MNITRLEYSVELNVLDISGLQEALRLQMKTYMRFAAEAKEQSNDDAYWQKQMKRVSELQKKIEEQTF